MVHTPVHASWLNQVEISFSVVQRKVGPPNDFTNLTEVRDRLRTFEDRYNATAQPSVNADISLSASSCDHSLSCVASISLR
ncbi:hypothetical protein [Streptomyces inhibens]|uniref:hypothetical protein n=1 Tax=Streptomyces inhibens TaxID=2293571 RepID=UPI001EE72F97|nr:hypothetical protein [Streptomyces inhibens]UKY54642.1 hypothetical protein KI385_41470 [Streptomyces inhibens]